MAARNSGIGQPALYSIISVRKPAYGRISSSIDFNERSLPKYTGAK